MDDALCGRSGRWDAAPQEKEEESEERCGTIRLKLLKIGALVKISVRRVLFSMASAFPHVDAYEKAWAALSSAA
jgi:hypothetical protein